MLSYEEIVINSILNLHPLQPIYWSQFFSIASQMLNAEEMVEMEKRIALVEMMVNGVERYVEYDEDGDVVVKERSAGNMTLYDIEMAYSSNADFLAYFERSDGVRITKLDVDRELDKIRKWVLSLVKERAYNMRFSRMI